MSEEHPFTDEQIAEWASFGPKLKGRPTSPEEIAAANERKVKTTAFKKTLATSTGWSEKKIEKELDRLVAELESGVAKPAYLDGPSGTRDWYPADCWQHEWLFDKFRATAKQFGFEMYDAPILESVELYERKAGEEITSQMYHFQDPEGKHVTLRPEMTPTLARLVLNKTNLQTGEVRLSLPLKWFSLPQCWRFETTQRGRKREHYQWNMDMVGVSEVTAELELLAAAVHFFESVGIDHTVIGIKVNSRAILEAILAQHGIQKGDLFAKVCIIIDKLDKIGGEAVTEMLLELGVDEESCKAILAALCAKSLEDLLAIVGADNPALQDVKRLFELAEAYGIGDYLLFDASVVRGLAYYTGIVWEAFDRRGQLRAIMGGGRYDRLLELYGGEKCQIPCVGFGFGDCVIVELLKECGKLPEYAGSCVDYVVCAYSPDLYGAAAKIASRLRANKWSVDLMPVPKKKVANSFKHADSVGARRMVFVAPDEVERGVVRIKDLRTKDSKGEGIQVDVPLDEIHTVDELIQKAVEASLAEEADKPAEA